MMQIPAPGIVSSSSTEDPNPEPGGARWQVSSRFWKQTEVGVRNKGRRKRHCVIPLPPDGGDKGTGLTHAHFPIGFTRTKDKSVKHQMMLIVDQLIRKTSVLDLMERNADIPVLL